MGGRYDACNFHTLQKIRNKENGKKITFRSHLNVNKRAEVKLHSCYFSVNVHFFQIKHLNILKTREMED